MKIFNEPILFKQAPLPRYMRYGKVDVWWWWWWWWRQRSWLNLRCFATFKTFSFTTKCFYFDALKILYSCHLKGISCICDSAYSLRKKGPTRKTMMQNLQNFLWRELWFRNWYLIIKKGFIGSYLGSEKNRMMFTVFKSPCECINFLSICGYAYTICSLISMPIIGVKVFDRLIGIQNVGLLAATLRISFYSKVMGRLVWSSLKWLKSCT